MDKKSIFLGLFDIFSLYCCNNTTNNNFDITKSLHLTGNSGKRMYIQKADLFRQVTQPGANALRPLIFVNNREIFSRPI